MNIKEAVVQCVVCQAHLEKVAQACKGSHPDAHWYLTQAIENVEKAGRLFTKEADKGKEVNL